MHMKANELRNAAINGIHHHNRSSSMSVSGSQSHANKCSYSDGGFKCGERAMPSTKYCRKHIFEDKKQILYRACNIEKSGVVCKEPVPDIFDNSTCVLHIELPPQREYTQKVIMFLKKFKPNLPSVFTLCFGLVAKIEQFSTPPRAKILYLINIQKHFKSQRKHIISNLTNTNNKLNKTINISFP